MKQTIITCITICILSLALFTGCMGYDQLGSLLNENAADAPNTQVPAYNAQTGTGISDEYNYCYSALDAHGKELYTIIYNAITAHSQSVRINDEDPDLFDRCFNSVLRDHPEIYCVYGYTSAQHKINKTISEFTPNYTFLAEELSYCDGKINEYVNDFMSAAPVDGTEYDKIKYIYRYVITHTSYDLDAQSNQTIYGAFVTRSCACSGYAKAVQYLCGRLGIMCILAVGNADGYNTSGSHAWNIVRIDGEYYHVDATWGDDKYKSRDETVTDCIFDYLCANDAMILKNHYPDDFISYPPCTSLNAFYYVREGNYLTAFDTAQISAAFKKSADAGNNYVILKSADRDIHNSVKEYLMEGNNAFRFVNASRVGSSEYLQNNVLIVSW